MLESYIVLSTYYKEEPMIITETRQRDKIAVIGMDNRQKELVRELKLRFQPSSVIHAKTPEDLKTAAGVIVLPDRKSVV